MASANSAPSSNMTDTSSGTGDQPVSGEFGQAFSLALNDVNSGPMKQTDATVSQSVVIPRSLAGNQPQLLAATSTLISTLLTSAFGGTNQALHGGITTVQPKDRAKAADEATTATQSQTQTDAAQATLNAILLVSHALPAVVPVTSTILISPNLSPASSTAPIQAPIPTPTSGSLQDSNPVPAPVQVSNASPSNSSTGVTTSPLSQTTAPDTLSFALLLHPKLAAQSTPGGDSSATPMKGPLQPRDSQSSSTSGTAQQTTAAAGSPAPSIPADPQAEPVSKQPIQQASVQSQASASSQSTGTPAAQPTASSISASVAHGPQSSNLPDPATERERVQAPASSGSGDAGKAVFALENTVANTPATGVKAPEAIKATPAISTPNLPPPATKEVVLRLQGQSGESISVRLMDQGGQLQVAVRSSDPATANLLRQDLSSLTNNLDRAGWKPEVLTSAPPLSDFGHDGNGGSGSDGRNSQEQGTLDWNQQDSGQRKSTVADLWDEILTNQRT